LKKKKLLDTAVGNEEGKKAKRMTVSKLQSETGRRKGEKVTLECREDQRTVSPDNEKRGSYVLNLLEVNIKRSMKTDHR